MEKEILKEQQAKAAEEIAAGEQFAADGSMAQPELKQNWGGENVSGQTPGANRQQAVPGAQLMEEKAEPKGLGGWLIVVIIGFIYSTISIIISVFVSSLPLLKSEAMGILSTPGTKYYSPMWKPFITGEMIVNFIVALLLVFILVSMFMKKRYVPKLAIGCYIFHLLVIIADAAIVSSLPQIDGGTIAEKGVSSAVASVISTIIWIAYFLQSKRVKNTFVK